MEYVISDTHFFHEQLLGVDQFAPRPYQTVEEMDQVMVEAWNARVRKMIRFTTLEISRLTTKTTNQNGLPMSKLRPSLVN